MPVKQIPDLNWEKEKLGKENTELDVKTEIENRTGPTLRSSKKNVNEIKKKLKQPPTKKGRNLCRFSFSRRHCNSSWSIHCSITIH